MDETSTRSASVHLAAQQERGNPEPPEVTWRELRPGLWVGRTNNRPAGLIERGRRYTFTDADDQVRPGYHTLRDAQNAATGPITVIPTARSEIQPPQAPDPGRSHRRMGLRLALAPSAAVLAAAVAGGVALATHLLP